MPEPTSVSNISVGSWFIKGFKDDQNGMCFQDGNNDRNDEEKSNPLLLHRMFEKFVEKTRITSDKEGKGKHGDHPALIEYLEGVKTEDMKTISYKELNEKSNRLARILIRKLGIHGTRYKGFQVASKFL